MRIQLILISVLLAGSTGLARSMAVPATEPSTVQVQRSNKIVDALALTDAARAARVSELIARQYFNLSLVHAKRDEAIKAAKAKDANHTASEAAIAQARAEATAAQDELHASFLTALATELTPEQIEKVKDGMTYGVLPLTYKVYQQMMPNLTAEQKAQILAWLTEAREHAMDASTSEEKHAWFGKYKGRINNYLSKAGYDLKAAEKNLQLHH